MKKLSKAIGIHILKFDLMPDLKPYHNVFHITDDRYEIPSLQRFGVTHY